MSIEIYCEEPSHEGRRWSTTYLWADYPGLAKGDSRYPRWVSSRNDNDRLLRGATPVGSVPEIPFFAAPESDGDRVRHKLRCRHCGLCVERRDDAVQRGLTRLADAGVTNIRLTALAAIL